MTQTKLPTRDELGTMLITDVLERWPAAAEVFMAHRMACAGCALARFYSVNDAALVYSLDATRFVEELLAAIPHPSRSDA